MAFDYKYKALDEDEWPREEFTATDDRQPSPFNSSWAQTLELLEHETFHLSARDGSVVIGTFHRPHDVLKSGQLRPETKMPAKPAVVVYFETYDEQQGRYQPAQFECDQFLQWKDNVRAVALGLQALRKVDRYNVGKTGAQYAGYLALPPAPITLAAMSAEDAAQELAKLAPWTSQQILSDADIMKAAYTNAAKKAHPDRGGSHAQMAAINVAAQVLRAHHNQ